MEKWEIKYQKGNDILLTEISANDKYEAIYLFYMRNRNNDLIEINEIIGRGE